MLANFNFPNQGVAEAFAKAQVLLYQVSPRFQHYFYGLQKHVSFGEPANTIPPQRTVVPMLAQTARSLTALLPKRRYRVDVVVCGIWLWARRQEDELLVNLLQSLLDQEASVLCLLHQGTSGGVAQRVQSSPGQLSFLDPAGKVGRLDARFRLGMAQKRAIADFKQVREILAPYGIQVHDSALPEFEWAAARLIDWEQWAPHVEFETALVRCHWLPLCSGVAHTALQRQKKTVTLQQGVVGHSLDVPILAHQYLCFGESSEKILKDMEGAFAQTTQRQPVCRDFAHVGAIFDPILELRRNFHRKTVLILGQLTRWANYLYGLEEQEAALLELVSLLCDKTAGLQKVVIRPHPASVGLKQWQDLASQFPQRCEISAAGQSLSDDLRRSSVTVSLFSGASVTAAASGLPSLFLQTPNGYHTQDLACCAPQFLAVEPLRHTIEQLCSDEETYLSWQKLCRENAAAYYANNQVCRFDRALVSKILERRA